MKLFQAGRGVAIPLFIALALFQPVRACVSHLELGEAAAAAEPSAPASTAPATPAAAPEPPPSPTAESTDTPTPQPAPIETGLVPIPSPTPKPPPLHVNPGVLQYPAAKVPGAPPFALPPGTGRADNAADLAGGVWYCRTFAGSVMTHAFSERGSTSSLAVVTRVPVDPDRIVTLHESYARQDATGAWRAVLANGMIEATAPVWNGDTWTFTGYQREGAKAVDFRMIFTRFGRDVFVRDFQHRDGGTWQTFSGETCRRNVAP